jgi:histidinol phosphatase-like PHP family hydrolase
MTWTPFDCHAHTTWSDGQLDPDALIATVTSRGVRPSIADHVSRDVKGAVDTAERLEAYLALLESLDVGRAAEFCWHDALWRELPREVHRRFTHTLGSLHAIWLPDGSLQRVFSRLWPADLEPHSYLDAHIDNLERLVREMPVDLLAHPTLVPIPLRSLPPEELWTEAHEERLVRLLRDNALVFEVSSRYRPHERLVRRAVEAGVRLSLGSDGHAPEQVGEITFSLALTRALGVADCELYDPVVHGRRPHA